MTPLMDCATCGGLIPADRRCCPHCHCKSSAWKRWAVVASATLGIGAADCNGTTKSDLPDLHAEFDMAHPVNAVEYGPAQVFDLAMATDAGDAGE